MLLWCSYCQKYIGETQPVENLSITHGLCKECRVKPKDDRAISQIKPNVQFFNQLKNYDENFQKINIDAVVLKAKSLDIRASDLFIGLGQSIYTKLTEKLSLENQETAQKFNEFILQLTTKAKESYGLLETNASEIICISTQENYPYASIRFLELLLREHAISPHMLASPVEEDFMSELKKFSPKIVVFSMWSEVYLNKILNDLETLSNPPLVIFDFAENRPAKLPSYAVGFSGDIEGLMTLIKSTLY